MKRNIFYKISNFFNELLFPEDIKCIFCGSDIPNFEEKPFCEECEKELDFNNDSRCLICDNPIDNEATICDSCQKHKRFFKKAMCPLLYNGDVRKAILRYKDSNQRYLAKPFASLIAKRLQEEKIDVDFITYVPLTKKKFKSRSFDQSKLLAEELSKILKVKTVCLFEKTRESKGQKYLTAKERAENMKGMYKLLPTKLEKSSKVLIVDDVITTCSTINTCAELIYKKVDTVYACALARNKLKG